MGKLYGWIENPCTHSPRVSGDHYVTHLILRYEPISFHIWIHLNFIACIPRKKGIRWHRMDVWYSKAMYMCHRHLSSHFIEKGRIGNGCVYLWSDLHVFMHVPTLHQQRSILPSVGMCAADSQPKIPELSSFQSIKEQEEQHQWNNESGFRGL